MKPTNFTSPPKSYWISSTESRNYPCLDKDIDVDIAIVGGGMAGITTAYQLRKENLKIAILEAENILMSTTAHTTGKITSQHGLIYDELIKNFGEDLARQYAEANERAIGEIRRIAEENNIDCDYTCQSSYIYSQDEDYIKRIKNEVEAASSLGIKATYIEELPLQIPIKAAIEFHNQAQFHPRRFLLPLAEIIQREGIDIYEHSRVIDLEEDGDNYILLTSQGKKVKAGKVIITSHYPFYNKESMYFARLYVERSYVIGVKSKEKFPGGMYISAEEPTRSLRSLDTEDGELILVVGEKHKTGQGGDTNVYYENLINFAKDTLAIDAIPYRWSTQDCMTMDGLPYIGYFNADSPNLYIATGFQKWGMTNSIVSSMIIKDLILKGDSPWKEVYSPSRKSIKASTKDFIVQNINVAGQLLRGKFSKLPDELNITPGEGKIFEHEGERIGAFRDMEGRYFFVDTSCTHMGCELYWNSTEKSWDCPCHGSRFSYDGKVLEGPAVKALSFGDDVNILLKLMKEDF